jgi:hypothetical protein
MQKERPSKTARKVALNIVTLGAKRGMEEVLPPGIVDATAELLVESGAVGRRAVRFSRSRMAVGLYLAFDWMMPGQFEAFAHRKAFCERQVRKGIETGAIQVIAFTYVGTRTNGRPDAGLWTWLVLWILKVNGEPWLWSMQPEELGPFLKQNNWTVAPDQMESSDRRGVEFFAVAMK